MTTQKTIELNPQTIDFETAESIARRELEQNSPFDVEKTGSTQNMSVTLNSSMNNVNIQQAGDIIEVKVNATVQVADAIEQALVSQSQTGRDTNGEMMDRSQRETRDVREPDVRESDEMGEMGEPMVSDATDRAGGIAADMTLYEDGRLHVEYPGGTTDDIDSQAGFFVGTDAQGQPKLMLSFYDDNFNLTERQIDNIIRQMRDDAVEEI